MKSIFKSKTALMAIITSAAGTAAKFYPEVASLVASNGSDILIALGVISFVLRKVTSGKVSLFPAN
jgi:hypothetical protein